MIADHKVKLNQQQDFLQFCFSMIILFIQIIHHNIQVSKMCQPQPQLLSLLQKIANPLESLSLKIKLNGIFAAPEQWKISDDANPNIFSYTFKILGQEYLSGKIQPRKLTQKQQRQLEQKNKKGGKKQSKQPQKQPQVDPVEEQKRQKQWNSLSELQKFHKTQEDPFKAFSLQFGEKSKQKTYAKQNLEKLEQKLNNNAIQIILIRKPEMSQQEVQKLKKSKPKNLNIGELYPMIYKGTINTKQLETPGCKLLTQRVKLVFSANVPQDGIKIQSDTCYAYIEIQLSEPITPQVKEIKPNTLEVIPDFPNKYCQESNSPILKLKEELFKSIKAISQEYILNFSKQKDHNEQKRHNIITNLSLSSISTLKLNEINKRREQFLSEFMNSGKYNIIKQRISKSLKNTIMDKFRKEKTGTAFSKEQINQTLSEINLFFQQQFLKIIQEFMNQENGSLHEDIVLGYEYSKQYRKNMIAPIQSQTQIQRQTRLAAQYEILQKDYKALKEHKAQKHYVNVLLLTNNSLEAKQNYAKFCLKCKKFNEAYILYSQISQQSEKLHYSFIQACLLIDRRRNQQAAAMVKSMIDNPECQTVNKISYNLLLSFMYQRENDIKSSEKYLAIAERYYKIKNNPHLKFTPTQNPYQLPKPKVPKPERYVSQLTHTQSQQIRLNFISSLSELNLYNLVSEYLPKLEDSNRKSIMQIQVDIFQEQYENALQKIEAFLKRSDHIRNIQYLMIKADICYSSEKMFQCQEIFLHILQLKPQQSKILPIYLKLGYIYLSRKSWEDAKKVFEKACEQKYNCSVAWLGLGISNLNIGKYKEAQQALNLSKIYNPLSDETAEYQKTINDEENKKFKVAQRTLNDY